MTVEATGTLSTDLKKNPTKLIQGNKWKIFKCHTPDLNPETQAMRKLSGPIEPIDRKGLQWKPG